MADYITIPALEVSQPLGPFYVTKIKAADLLNITFANELRVIDEKGGLLGNQRELKEKRVQDISKYIDSVESAFPNSIILAANYDRDGNLIENEEFRWRIEDRLDGFFNLIIPSNRPIAAIIDGQHRLEGFKYVGNNDRLETELLCSIYLDLPIAYQAYIFATINYNQKPVDKSLAFELFGYDLKEEERDLWTPEKLSVYMCRRLNIEKDSVFNNHIIVAPQNDNVLFKISPKLMEWKISTATIVTGIMSLFSQNPQRDRDTMYQYSLDGGRSRKILPNDTTPFRTLYVEMNDIVIYTAIKNFFSACENQLFLTASEKSYIRKTIGIQALFDLLKKIAPIALTEKKISKAFFGTYLEGVKNVDFSDEYFQASGIGRSRIRNILFYTNKLEVKGLKNEDVQRINQLLG